MLDLLHIKNIALINEARLSFSPGMTCITGESGSGKTAFLHGVQLAIGDRAQSDWLRDGASTIEVQAQFSLPEFEDAIIVKRLFGANSKVTIDGELANAKMLSACVGTSIEFCGQHEHQQLLTMEGQRSLLLDFGGEELAAHVAAYSEAYERWKRTQAKLEKLRAQANAGVAALDQARYTLERIEEVAPVQGEDEKLAAELARLEATDVLFSAAERGRVVITEEGGAADILGETSRELEQASVNDEELAALSERYSSLVIELEDIAQELRVYRDSLELNPEQLAAKQERMAALQGIMRTFGPTLAMVLEKAEDAKALIAAHDGREEVLAQAETEVASAFKDLRAIARTLAQSERVFAERLGIAITQKLTALEMMHASILVDVQLLPEEQWSAVSPTHIDFLYIPASGHSARALKKIASGGELSRVMLAIKAVESASDVAQTLVFDEVDAGIGGTAAVALARMLKELAATHQVICVTHLPQVAIQADTQFVVQRTENITTFTQVDGVNREREIARMLAGSITEESLMHARALLH